MPLSEDDVREILRLIDESDLEELRIETDAFSLYLNRASATSGDTGVAKRTTEGGLAIVAPMLGTFYRAEAPGAAPFVDVGVRVDPHTTVCLIEVMKMMNPIPAGVTGTIVEVCAENATPVEYGALLFQVRPDE